MWRKVFVRYFSVPLWSSNKADVPRARECDFFPLAYATSHPAAKRVRPYNFQIQTALFSFSLSLSLSRWPQYTVTCVQHFAQYKPRDKNNFRHAYVTEFAIWRWRVVGLLRIISSFFAVNAISRCYGIYRSTHSTLVFVPTILLYSRRLPEMGDEDIVSFLYCKLNWSLKKESTWL